MLTVRRGGQHVWRYLELCISCIFCSVEEGLESSYLCLWLLSFLRNNRRNTARYFPFLCLVTLATTTFICKLWGLEKNMKSQIGPLAAPLLPPSMPPSLPAWPACPLTSCPPPLFISEMCAGCAFCVLLQKASRCRCGRLPLTGARCLHSCHWHVSWPAVTRGQEAPVFPDPDPRAFPNKIHPHAWGGEGWAWELVWLSVCDDVPKATD